MRYTFENFVLDTDTYELRRDSAAVPLEPQVFEVLAFLVGHATRMVSKDELVGHIWPDGFIGDAALNSRVMAARRAIGDSGREQRLIKTVHGRGYRFAGTVRPLDNEPRRPAASAPESGEPTRRGSVAGPEIRYARTRDGKSIAYALHGQGPPLVRALGWFTHLELEWQWETGRRLWERLAERHTLVRYDGRGMGLSEPSDEFSVDTHLADLEAVVNAAGLSQFALLGISRGTQEAVHFARLHPDRVSHLIAYGGGPPPDDEAERAAWQQERETRYRVVRDGWGKDTPVYRQLFAHMLLGPDASPEDIAYFTEMQRASTSPERAAAYYLSVSYEGDAEAAMEVRVPTLVLHRRGDLVVPFSRARRLASLIPGARLHRLEGNNHWLLFDDAGAPEFVRLVDEFTGVVPG